MKIGWVMRKDWTVWTLVLGVAVLANVGAAVGCYWMGDILLANTYAILAGLIVLFERVL